MKKLQIALFLFLAISTQAQIHVRYNIVGYDPNSTKEAIIMSSGSCNGYTWSLKNSLNQVVASGTLSGTGTAAGDYMPLANNYKINFSSVAQAGNYVLSVQNASDVNIRIICQPYKEFLPLILRTIRVRRSASHDALDHLYSHGKDSSCVIWRRNGTDNGSWTKDAGNKTANMIGGHYDAGDYIKFTITEAYMIYHLLRAYEAAPEFFDGVKQHSTTSLDDLLDECKWGLDYLMKTHPSNDEFIIQTGGADDHKEWPLRLPEDDKLNGKRECYSSLSKTQMGLTAATLALGAKIFKSKGLNSVADAYEAKAIQIYNNAKASSINSAWWQGGHEVFYADNTPNDNMQLAAIELFNLTGAIAFRNDATGFVASTGSAYWSSWGNLNLQAHLRTQTHAAAALTAANNDLNYFRGISQRPNNLWGIPHESVWGSLASQMSVAHAALTHGQVTGLTTNRAIGQQVVDYLFGKNAWGLCFVANKTFEPTVKTSYATIYKLQPTKFPYGEIAAGPAPASSHAAQSPYFFPAHNANLWFKDFNTTNFTFFEQSGDYVCMETIITQLADAFFLITQASKEFCNAPLSLDSEQKKSQINDFDYMLLSENKLIFNNSNEREVKIYDISGKIVFQNNSTSNEILIPDYLKGFYVLHTVELNSGTERVRKIILP